MNDMTATAAKADATSQKPHYVIFDTETTGLFDFKAPADAAGQPRMASFGAIIADFDMNEIERVSFFIKPDGWSIEGTEAAKVNGLTDAFLEENGVPVSTVLDLWNRWLDAGLTMIAFNVTFDTKVMRAELRRAGLPDRFEDTATFCAMKALKPYAAAGLPIKGAGFVKLEAACAHFGITNSKAHDALADAEAAFHIMRHLMRDGRIDGAPAPSAESASDDVAASLPRNHNNPPEEIDDTPAPADAQATEDPIDAATAPYAGVIAEAENWLDGEPVSNEGQMKDVDRLLKDLKDARKAIKDAEEGACKPLYEAWKGEKARWKPTVDDLDRMVKGLAAIGNDFKKKLAAEKEAARRKAAEEAEAARRAAEEASREAANGDIEAQREAAAAAEQAKAAARAAMEAKNDKVKGLRTVHRYEITDHRAVLNDIVRHDRDAVTAFIEGYVAKHFRDRAIDGVTVTTEKEAF